MNRLSKVLVIGMIAVVSTHLALKVKARPAKARVPVPQRAETFFDESAEIDLPGMEVKAVYQPHEVEIGDRMRVTGIVVDGRARAYLETGMDQPDTHIAYDNVNGVNVAVAFCNRTGDGRVFCGESNAMRSIRVGGWRDDNMLLIVGDRRFAVNSEEIPLQELSFQSMKWGEWKARYPNTEIYLGSVLPKQR